MATVVLHSTIRTASLYKHRKITRALWMDIQQFVALCRTAIAPIVIITKCHHHCHQVHQVPSSLSSSAIILAIECHRPRCWVPSSSVLCSSSLSSLCIDKLSCDSMSVDSSFELGLTGLIAAIIKTMWTIGHCQWWRCHCQGLVVVWSLSSLGIELSLPLWLWADWKQWVSVTEDVNTHLVCVPAHTCTPRGTGCCLAQCTIVDTVLGLALPV